MKSTRLKTLGCLLLILLSIAYWLGSEICYAASIRPKDVKTVVDHFRRFGEPQRITQLQRGGVIYYELSGFTRKPKSPTLPVLALRSSPSAYVYDEFGKFVEWCLDPGDQPSYRERWPHAGSKPVEPAAFREKFGLQWVASP